MKDKLTEELSKLYWGCDSLKDSLLAMAWNSINAIPQIKENLDINLLEPDESNEYFLSKIIEELDYIEAGVSRFYDGNWITEENPDFDQLELFGLLTRLYRILVTINVKFGLNIE